MSRSIQLYLNDIVESYDKILRYTQGLSFEAFVADERTYGLHSAGYFWFLVMHLNLNAQKPCKLISGVEILNDHNVAKH